ncbi:non-ribosomal peptide synthetase [Clostridium beijerinckii]|uniref:Amino acid adenylation domain-containing protein n=4 Tax=Clostridium beijerinckii TaxID=1520 RepID=A0A9Q5CPZ3_CLOBE|nr:non-ribosomal peptide synthetase [Clostridium beijerinckii]AQS06435.1 tyrocidine synthase 1 [Clostridium beijerinckii]MBA2885812.1 amino acid adenylation domain-containing protein [Clostridium beijerinckii]MBA2900487.1 amino acid adenylation domain-containing protein [Clostridium beijerinckii]MBA2910371.1 amino acid adenylation domain-containing protein [Clostridium beijerinckii]MBA9013945.1 amino acid adenylation domain-containing protein [Clostridium beijerinckii]
MIDKFDQESGRTNSEDIEKSLEYSKKAIENKNYLEGEIKKIQDKSIGQLFENTAENFGDSVAIISEYGELTYKEVLMQVKKISNVLIKKGINRGDKVALIISNTADTIMYIMAIISIGAAYVPIDIKYPAARKDFIVEDCKAKAIISREERIEVLNSKSNDNEIHCKEKYFCDNTEDVCYVIYTSGTTGVPKGVEIKQSYVLNLCSWFKDTYNVSKESRVLSLNSLCFDASVKNIFTTFLTGGCVVLNIDKELSPRKLLKYIENNKVTHLNGTPSIIEELLETSTEENFIHFKSLDVLITGGERFINNNHLKDMYLSKNKNMCISNVYGPTECTSVTAFYMVTEKEILEGEKNIPIGKPICNKVVCIVDEDGNICGPNIQGEIWIGGEGVIKGYINREKLTAEKFANMNGNTFYRSGDMGFYDELENLHYEGRKDSQIKLNGYRIELDEISNNIEKLDKVNKCVCLYDNNMIIAFYTSNSINNTSEIKEIVKSTLPKFMIPQYIFEIDKFELTVNGKIDTNKLRTRFKEMLKDKNTEDNLTEIQKIVKEIWKKILKTETIALSDNFFDIGGNSLKLFQMSRHIEKEFSMIIEPIHLMELSNIKKISEFIEKKDSLDNEEVQDDFDFEEIRKMRKNRYEKLLRKGEGYEF